MNTSNFLALKSWIHGKQTLCSQCQLRILVTNKGQRVNNRKSISTATSQRTLPTGRAIAPESLRREGFVLKPIGAPIGFPTPPNPKEDWFQIEQAAGSSRKERHEASSKLLWKKWNKSYFRDIRNMDVNHGKFYLANDRLYKKDVSLFFPNLIGTTLASTMKQNTTSVLKGKISLVGVFSKAWAQEQLQTWIGTNHQQQPGNDPSKLVQMIDTSKGQAQLVEMNHEESKMISLFFPIFRSTIARSKGKEQYRKYFLMGGGGLPQTVKDTLAIMNDRIAYVFLVDEECRIRWSGCGEATDHERESLTKGLQKLLDARVKQGSD